MNILKVLAELAEFGQNYGALTKIGDFSLQKTEWQDRNRKWHDLKKKAVVVLEGNHGTIRLKLAVIW